MTNLCIVALEKERERTRKLILEARHVKFTYLQSYLVFDQMLEVSRRKLQKTRKDSHSKKIPSKIARDFLIDKLLSFTIFEPVDFLITRSEVL